MVQHFWMPSFLSGREVQSKLDSMLNILEQGRISFLGFSLWNPLYHEFPDQTRTKKSAVDVRYACGNVLPYEVTFVLTEKLSGDKLVAFIRRYPGLKRRRRFLNRRMSLFFLPYHWCMFCFSKFWYLISDFLRRPSVSSIYWKARLLQKRTKKQAPTEYFYKLLVISSLVLRLVSNH